MRILQKLICVGQILIILLLHQAFLNTCFSATFHIVEAFVKCAILFHLTISSAAWDVARVDNWNTPWAQAFQYSKRGIAGGQPTLDSDRSKRQINIFWLLLRKILTYRNFTGKICSDNMSGISLQWHLRNCVGSFDLTAQKAVTLPVKSLQLSFFLWSALISHFVSVSQSSEE